MVYLSPCQLSEKKIKKLKNGMHADGGNLYLNIRGKSRAWVFRFKSPVTQKIRVMGLGALPDITLEIAREYAKQNRFMLRNDLDPLQQKVIHELTIKKHKKTFHNIASEYIEYRSKQWKGKKQSKNFKRYLPNMCILFLTSVLFS